MAFQISPGVSVQERDITTIVPSVGTSDGGTVGFFEWGPGEQVTLIDSQDTLRSTFGSPNTAQLNGAHWWSAANFLSYSNRLHVVRAIGTGSNNSTFSGSSWAIIKNETEYAEAWVEPTGIGGTAYASTDAKFIGRYPGYNGNGIRVSMCDSTPGMFSNTATEVTASCSAGQRTATISTAATVAVGDLIDFANASDAPTGNYKITKVDGTDITVDKPFNAAASSKTINRYWEFYNNFDVAPGTSDFARDRSITSDEIHIAVSDADGRISGQKDTVLETYPFVSKLYDAVNEDGSTNYYKQDIQNRSRYIFVASHPASGDLTSADQAWGSKSTDLAADVTMKTLKTSTGDVPLVLAATLQNGATAGQNDAALQTGWDKFADADTVDISLAITGPASPTVARYVVDNISEVRKDCVTFISPEKSDVVGISSLNSIKTNVLDFRNTGLSSLNSSYAVMDCGWKYQFDKYNNTNRWIPLNGDIAGLCARTDQVRDPWWSPAGFNRGNIKNIVKLAWNPTKSHRDELYKNGINPVATFPGEGTVLFGDKTLLARPSAFDRINVRRLFIVLEKSIAIAARFSLFEFNDEFTRAQFRNLVDPFLREVQGRRGITDFRVICDETNNTGDVIDRNEFIGDIYIKPARSINFIQLNFIATRTGVDFNEVIGS